MARGTVHEYQMDIACLSEISLAGTGSHTIKVPGADSRRWFYYSGSGTLGQQSVRLSRWVNSALLSCSGATQKQTVQLYRGYNLWLNSAVQR